MSALGNTALFAALGLAVWGAVVSLVTYRSGDRRYLESARRALFAVAGLTLLASGALVGAMVRNDFTLKYVWEYSRTTQPFIYKVSALWGGMSGSLLFWCMLLALFSALAVTLNRKNNERILPFTSFVLFACLVFFLVLLNFKVSPFEPLRDEAGRLLSTYAADALARIEGNGLNPLLQNFYMAIHPPLLYIGLVGCAIPFAFILGALAHREGNAFWMRSARNWMLATWLALGMGIILGGYWAYIELGWGGYWAWDPVENASFMPWLTGTAFLHSFLMQSKRGIYRMWNVAFIVATFLLSIYGTYLTRSGILQSVHAFAQEDPTVPWYFKMGNIFLFFMGGMFLLSAALVWRRRALLTSDQALESAGSRESLVLYANLLFALFTFIVLFGVSSPIFYRMATGRELHHGPEFYNPRATPVALVILLAMGVASIAPWRRGGWAAYRKNLPLPLVSGASALAVSLAALFASGPVAREDLAARPKEYFYLLLCISLSFFVATIILAEYGHAVRQALARASAARAKAFVAPFRENPRRYGGYVVHLGMVLIFLGVAFSSVFQTRYQETLKVGDAVSFGPYTVRMRSFDSQDMDRPLASVNEQRMWVNLEVFEGGRFVSLLQPMRVFYPSNPEQPTYEVAIRSTLMRDFYTLLAGYDTKAGTAVVGAFVNPMVAWIWVGTIVVLLGGLVALVPMKRL